MLATLTGAMRIEAQGVVGDFKALGARDLVLPFFNLSVKEFLDATAVQTHQMVMVLSFVEFINRLAALEMTATQNIGLFKLRQHPVHRGQADVRALLHQHLVDVLGGHMPLRAGLEDFQDFQPRQGRLQAGTLEFVNFGHAASVVLPFTRDSGALPSETLPVQCTDHNVAACLMSDFPHRCVSWIAIVASVAALSACSSVDRASNRLASVVTPYKIDIVQGNFVSREQASALQTGMSRNQVKNILGTPLLTSIFHADRWDYVFTFKRQGLAPQSRRVSVFFKDDVLARIEADELPTETEFVASLDSGRSVGTVPVLEMSDESLKASAKPAATEPVKASPSLPTNYPPLEPPVVQ